MLDTPKGDLLRTLALSVPLALAIAVLAGCSADVPASSSSPMAEDDVQGYWLDITCPVQNLLDGAQASTIDEIHDVAAAIELEATEAAKLLRDPGAVWPEDMQGEIDVVIQYYEELADAFADASDAETLTEYQNTVGPRVQELAQVQNEDHLNAFLAIFERADLGSTPMDACASRS